MTINPIPIFPYNEHIAKALELLGELGPDGIDSMQWSMSVLVYRLSKLLCATPAPSGPVDELLKDDLQQALTTYPELRAHEASLRKAIALLNQVLQYAGWYTVDRVTMRTRPAFTDNIHPHQHPTAPQANKPFSSWGRPLPFRPLYCALGVFALAFPVRSDSRRYEKPPGEDALIYSGGDDKPKVREDRQRTFATLLDACDYRVGYWKAHFKSEPSFDAKSRKPLMSASAQRPQRIGNCYWRKQKNSLSPDIVIVKRRNQPPDLDNITHVVDMKFGEDSLREEQGRAYINMFGRPRFHVLYFPGDCQTSEPDERTQPDSDWVRVLKAMLMLLIFRGRGGAPGRWPNQMPVPAR